MTNDNYTRLIVNNNAVMYRNSNEEVIIPIDYVQKEVEFRASWVTPLIGDIARFSSIEQYKNELLSVLDKLESYNMNGIIFHVRIQNDAMYKSKLNPQSEFIKDLDFNEWNFLEWFIDECHKRNLEFHAWLNPYRIKASGYPLDITPNDIAKEFDLNNIASNPNNILVTTRSDSTRGAILNPGSEEVRKFVIDTCMELIENYNIDAIHFDDYFYSNLGTNGALTGEATIINEADQDLYIKYIDDNPTTTYQKTNPQDKANWRRDQVNIFIKELSTLIKTYNRNNNRKVLLGISPTGIYMNGDGKVSYDEAGNGITTGSNTVGQTHYSSYLFCDSKKWIDEEIIDYICPQTYWGFTHPVAGFADVVDWWVKITKNKNVRLFTGIGLYMADGNSYSWTTDENEASNQILYTSKYDKITGTVFFSYSHLKKSKLQGMLTIKDKFWINKTKSSK